MTDIKKPITILDEGSPEILAQALQIIVNSQHLIETDGPWAGKQPTKDNIRQYSFALVDEVTEYAKELGWKDWKLPKEVDPERVADEFADILAFTGVILDYGLKLAKVGVLRMAYQYRTKTEVNLQRVSGKVAGYGALSLHDSNAVPTADERQDNLAVGGYYDLRYLKLRTKALLVHGSNTDGIMHFICTPGGEGLYLKVGDDTWGVTGDGVARG